MDDKHINMSAVINDQPASNTQSMCKADFVLNRSSADSSCENISHETIDLPCVMQVQEINLSDIMDVVMNYKCKFCDLQFSDIDSLKSHVQTLHADALQNVLSSHNSMSAFSAFDSENNDSIPEIMIPESSNLILNTSTNSSQGHTVFSHADDHIDVLTVNQCKNILYDKIDEAEQIDITDYINNDFNSDECIAHVDIDDNGAQSKIFICGKCGFGFENISECHKHLIDEHGEMVSTLENDFESVSHHSNKTSVGVQVSVLKKLGRKRKNEISSIGNNKDVLSEIENDPSEIEVFETMGKRKVRPPKQLAELYVLSKRKHIAPNNKIRMEHHKLSCDFVGCTAYFKTQSALDLHNTCHVIDRNLLNHPFSCPVCSTGFTQWRILRLHLWTKHKLDSDLLTCDHCDFHTPNAQKLELHLEDHCSSNLYPCDQCGKSFKYKKQLTNHLLVHEGRMTQEEYTEFTEEDRQCQVCKRTFVNHQCLQKHVQQVHGTERPYLCTFCGHSTTRKAMMDLHLRTHTGEKPFKCDLCLYAAGDHNTLRRHRMRHTGQKPYKCPHCDYSCIQAISLKNHVICKHRNSESVFQCTVCSFKTLNKQNWENHREDHKNGLIEAQIQNESQDRLMSENGLNHHTGNTNEFRCVEELSTEGTKVDHFSACEDVINEQVMYHYNPYSITNLPHSLGGLSNRDDVSNDTLQQTITVELSSGIQFTSEVLGNDFL